MTLHANHIEADRFQNSVVNCGIKDSLMAPGAFWRNVKMLESGSCVDRDGRLSSATKVGIVSGWAYEFKILPDGRRQIFSIILPRELFTLPRLEEDSRKVVALTRLEVVDWSRAAPELGGAAMALWERTESERQNRMFDQMVLLGRLTAEERMLHLFLDLYHRLAPIGLVQGDAFKLPLTQELLADAIGLSVVHVNRTVQKLKAKGYITLRAGLITLHNPMKLAQIAYFDRAPRHMAHLDLVN
jgi:CRP-like cAMP-binding protein